MSSPAANVPNANRRINCARCGTVFGCNLGGHCWCADEAFRLPLPAGGAEDCLCPECLHAMARAAQVI